jgi:Zn-dependent protease
LKPRYRTYLIQGVLFVLTLITTTLAGAEWTWGSSFWMPFRPMGWAEWLSGLYFSVPFLGILTIHEMGHYVAARLYRVRVTLPYYLPIWLGPITSIGTLGAFIRIKSRIKTRQQYFDIGIAGPLAGFVVALAVLWYGFTHLPTLDYLFEIHPEYQKFGSAYAQFVYRIKQPGSVAVGDNLVFWFFKHYVATDPHLVPHPFEVVHYPYLFAGYMALFFTALNLIPIGQLDGGHILYGLIGQRYHRWVSPVLFTVFLAYAGIGVFRIDDFMTTGDEFYTQLMYLVVYAYFLYLCFSRLSDNRLNALIVALSVLIFQLGVAYLFPTLAGAQTFLPFLFLIGRVLGVYHPDAEHDTPLDWKRKALGWFALGVFIICFTPTPFIVY